MALQDLTPQLRTRLSRMERAVGVFVMLALGLLLFGFCYYVYNTAERKGWFKFKAPYFTFVDAATGLNVGDPVRLMGLNVGQITRIVPQPPEDFEHNMYVEFEVVEPNHDYLWTEGSRARVATADLLGKRVLEVTKGSGGHPIYIFRPVLTVGTENVKTLEEPDKWLLAEDVYDGSGTNLVAQASEGVQTNLQKITNLGIKQVILEDARLEKRYKAITAVWNDHDGKYEPFGEKKLYWLKSDESPAVTERLEAVIAQVEAGLPNILNLTNQLSTVLSNTTSLTSNLNQVAAAARPLADNLGAATAHLDQPGALGELLLPTNVSHQLETTLASANAMLTNANGTVTGVNTNLEATFDNMGRTLDNLANITSNLNAQVQANNNMLTQISKTVVDADDLVQGLKRHWLLRSAFKSKPPSKEKDAAPKEPVRSPKDLR